MGMQNLQNLQNLPNLPHTDVLEKLKMQVRDMKVGLMEGDFRDFPLHSLATPANTSFTLPQSGSTASNVQPQNLSSSQSSQNGFLFTPPNAPKDGKEFNYFFDRVELFSILILVRFIGLTFGGMVL